MNKRSVVQGVSWLVGLLLMVGAVYALNTADTDHMRKIIYNNVDRTDSEGLMMMNAQAYQVDITDGTVIYKRWRSGTGSMLVEKISLSSTVWTYEKATGTWANRATLTYVPIND